MTNEESCGPSCNILSKNLRLLRSKDSVNTAHCSVDLRLINAKFVSYNGWALPPSRLPSRLPEVTYMTLSPRPSPSVLQAIKIWRRERGYIFIARLYSCIQTPFSYIGLEMWSGYETVANHRKTNIKQQEATGNRIRKEVVEWRKRIHYLFLLGNPGGVGERL